MPSTYTYATLEVSPSVYQEIAKLLRDAGYFGAFEKDSDGQSVIDMHGIALKSSQVEVRGDDLERSDHEPLIPHKYRRPRMYEEK